MRGGRGGVRVGLRGNFQKKSTFSKKFMPAKNPEN